MADKRERERSHLASLKDEKIYLESVEFSAFSQNGEDGILDFLIEILELDSPNSRFPRAFIEFGVQNYLESNTRFLLQRRNWQGFIMDGDKQNIDFVNRGAYWKYDLEAKCAFITRENINDLIESYLASRNFNNVAVLSIDIDGVDYFVFEAITIKPAIVIIEYNALFGSEKSVSVPYRADFEGFSAHFSGLYFGASIKAMINLARKKGYIFVGADKTRTNLFFVLEEFSDKISRIATFPLDEYARHHARQSRDKYGKLSFLGGEARNKLIEDLPLFECD